MINHDKSLDQLREMMGQMLLPQVLQSLPEIIADGLILLDSDFRIVVFNDAAARFLNREAKDVIGKILFDEAFKEAKGSIFEVEYRQAFEDQKTRTFETYFGVEPYVNWYDVRAYPYQSGLAVLFIVSTERREREEELKRSEEKFRMVSETLSEGLWLVDKNAKTTYVNPFMARMLGYEPEEMTGRHLFEFMGERERVACEENLMRRKAGIEEVHDFVFKHKLGHNVLTLIKTNPIFDDNGDYSGAVGAVSDLTERRRFEHQVRQTQKLESLGVLAGGIAHDFNNLLMGVLGNADLALDDLSPSAPARPAVEEIITAARRAADLCRQMLAYSGKGKFVVQLIDLSELVTEMVNLLEVSISKTAVLKLELAPDLPPIEADATQIRQIVMNLLTNASEAIGSRSGVIAIKTGAIDCTEEYLADTFTDEGLTVGTYVFLEVSDTGCGMSDETLSRIFDPFFSTKFTGRGLGLAAVLGIVRGHHGAIKVYSEVGKGSSFKALFPAISGEAEDITSNPSVIQRWQGSGTVLLVDDEETVRAVGKRMLKKLGFEVLLAAHGREAIEVIKEKGADIVCVLLDLTMPHLDGEETFRQLRSLMPHLPVVLTSGYNEQDVIHRFSGKGLAGFIQKPYQTEALARALRQILD